MPGHPTAVQTTGQAAPAPPRYAQSKEQSAELVRAAMARMAAHPAAFNPMTFAVWYEHIAGINPRLSGALDEKLRSHATITDDIVGELHRQYVADADCAVAQQVGGSFERAMARVSDCAATAHHEAASYGAQLARMEEALVRDDPVRLHAQVSETIAGTRQLQSAVQSLQQTALRSREEIGRLRADLLRYRIEAVTDPLTGLLNRKGFDERLHELLAGRPPPGTSHCLLMLDIDHFKRVNDRHGHLVGDAVLRGLGDILRRATADWDAACARFGGEEFAILMHATTVAVALRRAESICCLAKAMKVRNGRTGEVIDTMTLSGGVAAWQRGDHAASLIASADAALYRSKEMGRDRVTVA
jgi:diguanylate cyclase